MRKIAILGGKPYFNKNIPIIKPFYNKYLQETIVNIKKILESNMVTNVNNYVNKLEKRIEKYLDVKNCVLISSCTIGMLFAIEAYGLRKKEILMPSFTFSATANAAYFGGAEIKLIDCDQDTFNISLSDLESKLSDKTAAILAVHIFGNPCNIESLENIAKNYNLKLIFDSAHAFGSIYKDKKIGNFGDVEIFSCSPTKIFSTIEGGILTTNDDELAKNIKIARNYGNLTDYNCKVPGLNGRMTELNAAIGLEMFSEIDTFVNNRRKYSKKYCNKLKNIPGIRVQKIEPESISAYKDFGIIISPREFGLTRDQLAIALEKENISVKKYFYPPIHMMDAYQHISSHLTNTENISNNILCLPIYNFMEESIINGICDSIKQIYKYSEEIKRVLN